MISVSGLGDLITTDTNMNEQKYPKMKSLPASG